MLLFSEYLRELLQAKGMTVSALSRLAGVERTALSKALAGQRVLPYDALDELIYHLRLTPGEEERLRTYYDAQFEKEGIRRARERVGRLFSDLAELTFAPGAELSAMPYAFLGCTGLTQVEVPAAATGDEWADAWEHVFEGCTGLQAVTFRDGAARVGESMFEGCTNLSQVTLSDSVTAIDSWAFADCSDLADLAIPHAVAQVQEDAFSGCDALQTIRYDGYPDEWADVLVPSDEPGDGPLAGVTVICITVC